MTVEVRYWRPYIGAVTGAAHRHFKKSSQDSVSLRLDDDRNPTALALAVSDGHGSAINGKIGAYYAAETATRYLLEARHLPRDMTLAAIERYSHDHLRRQIVAAWVEKVRNRERTRKDTAKLLSDYGCTLLSVLITSRYLLFLQLGDGDIVLVHADGQVHRPIPPDPRLFANETTSLSQVDHRTTQPVGWLEMHVALVPLNGNDNDPALILLATDGYANSFSNKAAFEQVARDVLDLIFLRGWDYVRVNIDNWLEEATLNGSGDDITTAIVWNSAGRRSLNTYITI